MNNDNSNPNIKKKRSLNRQAKSGAYSLAFAAILLALLIVVNLIVYKLTTNLMVFETTPNRQLSITETTENFVKSIDQDVTIYFICEDSVTNIELETLIKHYTDINSKLKYEVIDPISNPSFTPKYTDTTLSNYSIIIESDLRFYVIDYYDLYYVENTYTGRIDYLTFLEYTQGPYASYYSSYFTEDNTELFFNGEAVITTGFDYVTQQVVPHIYLLSNHGETGLDEDVFLKDMEDNGIEYEYFDLLENGSVPDTCTCLVIGDPDSDISAQEAKAIIEYLDAGGSMILLTSPEACGFSNLLSVMEHYGLTAETGTIYEGNASYYPSNSSPNMLLPTMNENHDIVTAIVNLGYASSSANLSMLMPNSHSIRILDDTPENVTITTIASTSDKAYLTDTNGDAVDGTTGSHVTGVLVIKTVDSTTSNIIWYSSADAFTSETISERSINQAYLLLSMSYVGGISQFSSELASEIQAISQNTSYLNLSATSAVVWGVVTVIVVPAALLVVGLTVWLKRRKR